MNRCAFLIWGCLTFCFSHQESADPDSVLTKAIEAHGGTKNIGKPRMGILKGAMKGMEITQEEVFDLPKRWKRTTILSTEDQRRTAVLLQVDGKNWKWEDVGAITRDETTEVSYFGVLTKFIELKNKKVALSPLPEQTAEGRPLVGFATKSKAESANYFFDKKTGLLFQTEFKWEAQPGKVFDAKSVFGDYKVIDGVKLPYRRTYYLREEGLQDFVEVADFVVEEVRILDRIADDVFTIPDRN